MKRKAILWKSTQDVLVTEGEINRVTLGSSEKNVCFIIFHFIFYDFFIVCFMFLIKIKVSSVVVVVLLLFVRITLLTSVNTLTLSSSTNCTYIHCVSVSNVQLPSQPIQLTDPFDHPAIPLYV